MRAALWIPLACLLTPLIGCAQAEPPAAQAASGDSSAKAPAPPGPVSIADQPANTWVKRSPLPGGPPSPRLGYESSWGYDQARGVMIRWGAHDPGGGGPQLSETWAFDIQSGRWQFMRTNNNPPGNCCCRENVFNPQAHLFTRFSYPAFGHGWYWDRSRYLREDSVWTYDPGANRWRDMRPSKAPALNVGKGGAWDPKRGVIWIYDTKLRVYDPWTNTWRTANQSEQIHKRSYGGMALDFDQDKIVLFGNQGGNDERTWVYDIQADKWIDAKPPTHPPAVETSPTLVYDSLNRKVIAVVLGKSWRAKDTVQAGLETWTYDVAANEWKKMNPPAEPDWSSSRSRLMRYLPDRNIVILENRTKTEQQVWTYRLAAGAPPKTDAVKPVKRNEPPLVLDSRVDVLGKDKVVYSWKKSADSDVVGYVVERAVMATISAAQKVSTAAQYKDKLPLEAMAEKRGLSEWVRLTPKPITGTSLTDNVDLSKKVEVKQFDWQPYFGTPPVSEQNKAYDMSKPGCPFTVYAYRVRAVNRQAIEGGPSPYQLTIPNEVENLFSREVESDIHLKWSPSPHEGIAGYLVFRLNGRGFRWDKDSQVVLLTPEPIRATTFVDRDVRKSRRYYVVVVDRLGQQGLPSHGTWGFRPWRNHYAPWLPKDGWHQ